MTFDDAPRRLSLTAVAPNWLPATAGAYEEDAPPQTVKTTSPYIRQERRNGSIRSGLPQF